MTQHSTSFQREQQLPAETAQQLLAKLDHKVMRLKRMAIGPVKLDKLPKGKARRVSEEELKSLRAFVAKAQEKIAAIRAKERKGPGMGALGHLSEASGLPISRAFPAAFW